MQANFKHETLWYQRVLTSPYACLKHKHDDFCSEFGMTSWRCWHTACTSLIVKLSCVWVRARVCVMVVCPRKRLCLKACPWTWHLKGLCKSPLESPKVVLATPVGPGLCLYKFSSCMHSMQMYFIWLKSNLNYKYKWFNLFQSLLQYCAHEWVIPSAASKCFIQAVLSSDCDSKPLLQHAVCCLQPIPNADLHNRCLVVLVSPVSCFWHPCNVRLAAWLQFTACPWFGGERDKAAIREMSVLVTIYHNSICPASSRCPYWWICQHLGNMASALAIRTCLSVIFFSFVLGINHFIFADSLKLCQTHYCWWEK